MELAPWHSDTWVVEVDPARAGCAAVSVSFDGFDLLSVTIGHTWFESWPVEEDVMAELRAILEAVFAGRFEEAGAPLTSFGRVVTQSGVVHFGHMHLPWPWRWRRVRRYLPYGAVV